MSATKETLQAAEQEVLQLQQRILSKIAEADQESSLSIEAKKVHALSPRIQLQQCRQLKGHFGKIYAMHWSPSDPHILCSAAQDGSLLIWDAFSSIRKLSIPLESPWVMSVALSPGHHVACGGLNNKVQIFPAKNTISVEQIEQGHRIAPTIELTGHDGYLSFVRWASDHQILTSSGDGTCMLWDVTTGQQIQRYHGHCGDVMTLSISNNGQTFISGSVDRTVKLWDTRLGNTKSIQTFFGHQLDVNSVQFFPDGNSFVSGSDDQTVRLFDLRARAQLQKFDKNGYGITSTCVSNTGKYVFASTTENTVHSWCSLTGSELQTLEFHDRVSCVGMNSQGNAFATASWDSTVQVFA